MRRLWRRWFPTEGVAVGRVQWPTREPIYPPPTEGGKSSLTLFREMAAREKLSPSRPADETQVSRRSLFAFLRNLRLFLDVYRTPEVEK